MSETGNVGLIVPTAVYVRWLLLAIESDNQVQGLSRYCIYMYSLCDGITLRLT